MLLPCSNFANLSETQNVPVLHTKSKEGGNDTAVAVNNVTTEQEI